MELPEIQPLEAMEPGPTGKFQGLKGKIQALKGKFHLRTGDFQGIGGNYGRRFP